MSDNRQWYRMTNTAPRAATVHLYDDIGAYGITAKDFGAELDALEADELHLHINSRGGGVFEGIAIHNQLRNHPAAVHGVVDGLAASIASVVAMACDTLTMGRGAQLMIHNAMGGAVGFAEDMDEMAALLRRTSAVIAGFYQERAGGSLESWAEAMARETWYSADEAVAAGLADRTSTADVAASASAWDLSAYRYAGRDRAPAPVTESNRSRLVRARARVLRKGAA